MKFLQLILMVFLSNHITAQCFQNQMMYNFESNIQPWEKINTYSFGHSYTSFESGRSVFAKVAFGQNNQQTRAGASTNFNNIVQQWADYQGIQFDFIFVNVANDGTTANKPAARAAGSRTIYLELSDQSGKKLLHYFTDENNNWHQRKVFWNEFTGDQGFNKNAIVSMGFYTDRNNQNYTEVFRFDDIELFCDEGVQPNVILLSDVAKNFNKPKGAPNYSDVCLTSRYRRFKSHSKYPVSTEEAIDGFHPTRLDWIYVTDQSYIKDVVIPRGLKFSATLNTQLPDNFIGPRTYENGRCVKQDGTKFKLPWLNFGDGIEQYSGSVNEPAYRSIFIDHARIFYQNIDPKHLTAVQMDDSGFNYRNALDFGGCYGNGDQQMAQNLGYNIYTQHSAFQKKATELFYDDMLNQIRSESGNSNIGFSMNNDGHVFTDRVMASSFDFAMGELYNERATPVELYRVSQEAKKLGKLQVFSPVRYVTSGNGPFMFDANGANTSHININRKCIATAYAIGTMHFVPWDTWFYGSTRHFGKAKDYADLFAMIRAIPKYFDDYEEAALYSPDGSLPETRYNGTLPVTVNANNNNIWAFARVKPNNAEAPIVIHLVNWNNSSTNATVEILNNHISSEGTFTAKLIIPKAYNASAHQSANQQATAMLNGLRGSYQASAYQNLIDVQQIPLNAVGQNKTALNLSNLKTWSILILDPSTSCEADTDEDGVCDTDDICANGDDNTDIDGDGTPDACDICPNNANNSCEIPSYCASTGNIVQYEYIDNVSVDQLSNDSGSNGGYKDFTNISENLITGTSVEVSLTPGYVDRAYTESWKIWIDFNRDGDFEDEGEEVFSDIGNGTISGSITIPVNASLGATGMRVSLDKPLKVYPNPAKDFIYIDLSNVRYIEKDKPLNVQIFSTDGKLLLDELTTNDEVIKVNIPNLPKNKFYLIHIDIESISSLSTKFLKL